MSRKKESITFLLLCVLGLMLQWFVWRSEDNSRQLGFSPTTWALQIDLRSSGLAISTVPHESSQWPSSLIFFINNYFYMYRGLPTHKVCVLPAFQVLLEARRGQMDPLRLELWMDGCEPPGGCWGSNFTTH